MRESLSSNHFSTDQQLHDVVSYLEHNQPEKYAQFLVGYPEWRHLGFIGTSSQLVKLNFAGGEDTNNPVDPDLTGWMIDWIEDNTDVYWEDGEPWVGRSTLFRVTRTWEGEADDADEALAYANADPNGWETSVEEVEQ